MADETVVKKPDGEQEKKPTVSDIIKEAEGEKKSDAEMVPLATLMEIKNDNKELKKTVKDLQDKIDSGAGSKEIAADVEALAKKYDVEPGFAKELLEMASKRSAKVDEKKVDEDPKIKEVMDENTKLKARERQEQIDKAFTKYFGEALETMPEFKDIVDADVIKTLSLLPANANKTFAQLIEDTYGKAVTGKRTIETTKPAGGKDPEPIDYAKAKKDTKYFEEIMANPTLKAEYNKNLIESQGARKH